MTLFLEIHPQEVIKDVQQDLSTRVFIAIVYIDTSRKLKTNKTKLKCLNKREMVKYFEEL